MSKRAAEALAFLKALGTPTDLANWTSVPGAPSTRLKVNAHIHLPPNFSAFQTVAQAIELSVAQGIRVLGVSNYYDYNVYGDFAAASRKAGVFPLFGLEIICLIDELVKGGVKINDPGNPGKMYVCGKGITRFAPFSPEGERLLGIIRHNDSTRMREVIAKLAEVLAQRGLPIQLTEGDVIDMVAKRHDCPRERIYLQERHVCQAFQEAIFAAIPVNQRIEKLTIAFGLSAAPKFGPEEAVKIQNEIRAQLMKAGKPAYVEETFVSYEQAYQLIIELGGLPFYPTLADGIIPICPFETPVEKLIAEIKGRGFVGAEFIPLRNTPEVLSHYVKAMRAAGLIVTAGTEHNTLDLVPIEPTCMKAAAIPDDVKAIFWEGACVVAAHQFLTLHQECGFIDAQGRPNPKYPDAASRIAGLSSLGEAVIQRYLNSK
jgi:hypothetical protein